MRRYVLVLMSVFLVFVLASSTTLASISIPPSNPTIEPPGPSVFEEQTKKLQIAADAAKNCEENLKRCEEYCSSQYSPSAIWSSCIKKCREEFSECMKGVHYFLNPPQLILPNGGSPGQGN